MKIISLCTYSLCAVLSVGVLQSIIQPSTATARGGDDDSLIGNVTTTVKQDVDSAKDSADNVSKEVHQQVTHVTDKAGQRNDSDKEDDGTSKSLSGQKSSKSQTKEEHIARLDAKHLDVCKKRQSNVIDTMHRSASQGLNQLDVFKKIADRTVSFYAERGNTVSNYNELVADMNAKYQAAHDVVYSVSNASSVFDCAGDNPKGTLLQFRDANKAKNAALKDYRTSVKNLIVAVKSAQSQAMEAR